MVKLQIIILLNLFLFFSGELLAQEDVKININGYNIFYGEDSVKISEGTMSNGKPDGYWKNYYSTGILKSEGNRLNYELDSIWKFYDEEGKIILEISYKTGKKMDIEPLIKVMKPLKKNL